MDEREKRYVDVVALTASNGHITPIEVRWNDGRRFHIDKITEQRHAHSIAVGGAGICYTIRIGRSQTHLWYDSYHGKWFVEAKRQ